MILAFHSIFSAYGFWLPNDPRGSGSDYVASWELFRYGPATKVNVRRSVAAKPHDVAARLAAKQALHHEPIAFTDAQACLVAAGFATAAETSGYRVHACAVLPEHVHLVVAYHPRDIRKIVGHMKTQATLALKRAGHWTGEDRPLWGDHGWNVFLNDEASVRRAIRYVEENPVKEGKPSQHWDFVVPFHI